MVGCIEGGGLQQTNKLQLQKQSSQKTMKFQDSLLTETTKQSLIQPLLVRPAQHQNITVFVQSTQGLLSVTLPLHSAGVEQLVEQALQRLNHNHHLQLSTTAQDYLIFAARRSGKRYNDYPAIEPSQNALLTKVSYYYLKAKKDSVKAVGVPQTQMGVPLGKREEKKPEENRSCFCLF